MHVVTQSAPGSMYQVQLHGHPVIQYNIDGCSFTHIQVMLAPRQSLRLDNLTHSTTNTTQQSQTAPTHPAHHHCCVAGGAASSCRCNFLFSIMLRFKHVCTLLRSSRRLLIVALCLWARAGAHTGLLSQSTSTCSGTEPCTAQYSAAHARQWQGTSKCCAHAWMWLTHGQQTCRLATR